MHPSLSDHTKTFTPEEVLYDLVKNDENLIAKMSQQAVETCAHTFIQ
jgi:hypothetical protein